MYIVALAMGKAVTNNSESASHPTGVTGDEIWLRGKLEMKKKRRKKSGYSFFHIHKNQILI